MQEWIKENYDKNIPSSTIEYNLHKANYSWKSNRPSPYKGDEEKQKEFKKKELRRWLKS
jgi:transposase